MARVIKLQNGVDTLLPISDATAIQMTVDNTTKSVQDVILENEEIFAAAMTDLNSQMQDIQNAGYVTAAQLNEAGYLSSFTETDPSIPSYVRGITESDISYWNEKQDSPLIVTLTGVSAAQQNDSVDGVYFTTNKTNTEINSASIVWVFVPSAIAQATGLSSTDKIIYPNGKNKYQLFVENTLVNGYFDGTDNGNARFYVESFRQFVRNNEVILLNSLNSTIDLYGGEVTYEDISNGDWDSQVPSIGVTYSGISTLDSKIHRELSSYVTKTELNAAGYLQSETDPTVPSYVKGILESDISYWNEKQDIFIVTVTGVSQNGWAADGQTFTVDKTAAEVTAAIENYKQIYVYLPSQYTTEQILSNIESSGIERNKTYRFLINKGNELEYIHSGLLVEGGLYNDSGTEIFYLECFRYIDPTNTLGQFIQYIQQTYSTKEEINNASYLQSETDPTVPSYVKNITETNITKWNSSYCPVVVDTRTSAANVVTANAPFDSLQDGQQIILVTNYATSGSSTLPTLNLTLSNNTTTGGKAMYYHRNGSQQQIGSSNFQMPAGVCIASYVASKNGWYTDWHYPYYSNLSAANIDSSNTGNSLVSGSTLRSRFYTKAETASITNLGETDDFTITI